ncbi:MAG: membrane protein insertion efficiency factor YidD [bacterium]|nr:MAG: membrane protein insertion efficiency factor YidD [bacterium]
MASRIVARVGLTAVRIYRAAISPYQPPVCRFIPSCSEYAETALLRYGAFKGAWLALRRLLRCNPFARGGYDPVR